MKLIFNVLVLIFLSSCTAEIDDSKHTLNEELQIAENGIDFEEMDMSSIIKKLDNNEKVVVPFEYLYQLHNENRLNFEKNFSNRKIWVSGRIKSFSEMTTGFPIIHFENPDNTLFLLGSFLTGKKEYRGGGEILKLKKGDVVTVFGKIVSNTISIDIDDAILSNGNDEELLRESQKREDSIKVAQSESNKEYIRNTWENRIKSDVISGVYSNDPYIITFINETDYNIEYAKIQVDFYRTFDDVLKSEFLELKNIKPQSNISEVKKYVKEDDSWDFIRTKVVAVKSKEFQFEISEH